MATMQNGMESLRGFESAQGSEHAQAPHVPIWMWPQMLSLDAVAVYAVWAVLFPVAFGVNVSVATVLVGSACVWCIYVGDHLLDLRSGNGVGTHRHEFVRRHQRGLITCMIVVLSLGIVGSAWLSRSAMVGGVVIAVAVIGYLVSVHRHVGGTGRAWPKEMVVAAAFALASSLPAWSAGPMSAEMLVAVALFGGVCLLNCAGLEHDEWLNAGEGPRPHRSAMWLGSNVVLLSVILTGGAVAAALIFIPLLIGLPVAASALMLAVIFGQKEPRSADEMRATADIALLTPLLFLVLPR
jgi:hypothetical protein